MTDAGNPQADDTTSEESVVSGVMASGSEDYFEQLEKQVNGNIYDDTQKEEQVTTQLHVFKTLDITHYHVLTTWSFLFCLFNY